MHSALPSKERTSVERFDLPADQFRIEQSTVNVSHYRKLFRRAVPIALILLVASSGFVAFSNLAQTDMWSASWAGRRLRMLTNRCSDVDVPMYPTPSQDTLDLQALVDKYTGSSKVLHIDRDFEITTSIVISGPITIEGFSGELTMEELKSADGFPPVGKLPTIIMVSNFPAPVFNVGPGNPFSKAEMCTNGCDGWAKFYNNRTNFISHVSIKGLYIVGNYKKMEVPGLTKRLTSGNIFGDIVPGLPQRQGLCNNKLSPFFPHYEYETCRQIQELDFTRDAFSYIVHATFDPKAKSCYRYEMDSQCVETYKFGCKNVKASAVTITSAKDVAIRDVFVVNGNSACVSAFFNSANVTIQRARLHTAMFDGFGPDMLHSAKVLDSVMGPFGNAGISISNGQDPPGTIVVANTHFLQCGMPAYLNSNNHWEFMGCTVDGAPSCDVCGGPKTLDCHCTTNRPPGVGCADDTQCISGTCSPSVDGGDCTGATGCICLGRAEGVGCSDDGQCASLLCSPPGGGQCAGRAGCACRVPLWAGTQEHSGIRSSNDNNTEIWA